MLFSCVYSRFEFVNGDNDVSRFVESDRSFVSEIGISAKFYNIGYRRVQITDNRLNDRLTNTDNHKRLAHAMVQR